MCTNEDWERYTGSFGPAGNKPAKAAGPSLHPARQPEGRVKPAYVL